MALLADALLAAQQPPPDEDPDFSLYYPQREEILRTLLYIRYRRDYHVLPEVGGVNAQDVKRLTDMDVLEDVIAHVRRTLEAQGLLRREDAAAQDVLHELRRGG